MTITLILAWSAMMAAPPTAPLTAAERQREYDLVKVEEVLTPEQIKLRDVIPGWRPITPLSDIQRAADEIVPGEPNPYLIFGLSHVSGHDLTHADLDQLGPPSPSPRGFAGRSGAREAWWYEQIDEEGQMTGIWMAVFKTTGDSEAGAYVMVGRLFMGPNVFDRVGPGIDATTKAVRSLKRTLSGEEPPSPQELLERYYEKRKRMLQGQP